MIGRSLDPYFFLFPFVFSVTYHLILCLTKGLTFVSCFDFCFVHTYHLSCYVGICFVVVNNVC